MKRTTFTAACSMLVLLLAFATEPVFAVGTTVDKVRLSVRIAPQPVMSDGKLHAVYEVHIENQGEQPLMPLRFAAHREGAEDTPVILFEADELLSNMEFFDDSYRGAGRDYLRDSSEDPNTIGAGMIGVVYVWLTLDPPVSYPNNWLHKVTLGRQGVDGGEITLAGGTVTLSPREPVRVGPPVEGGPWWVMESMGNNAVHRRAMVLEMPFISQRYGADYIMLGDSGSAYAGDDISQIDKWYGYGRNVLAVADGIITDVIDGIADNVPGSGERLVEMRADTINGNYVVLEIGAGMYAAYAHLAPGSLQVSLGQAVKKGDILGKLGNTGNSGGPHLHFHISSGNHIFDAEGLPFVYKSFGLLGTVSVEELQSAGFKPDGSAEDIRRKEIPGYNSVIVFPDDKSRTGE